MKNLVMSRARNMKRFITTGSKFRLFYWMKFLVVHVHAN
jgi:hypothetical protein